MSLVSRSWAARSVTGVTLCLTLALSVAGCSGSDSSAARGAPPAEATDPTTALADLDTTSLVVRRAPFCDMVDPAAIERALGADPVDVSTYASGQRVKLSDDVADVVHEFGCRWTAGDGTAEAWVFAPPVTAERAAGLARRVEKAGCADTRGPAFGDPWGMCLRRKDGVTRLSYGGLFGDAWLGCDLVSSGSGESLADRGQEWCTAVALGAASAP